MDMTSGKRYVNAVEAANILCISVGTLNNWRYQSRGPNYAKIGSRVLYDMTDLQDWLEKQKIHLNQN